MPAFKSWFDTLFGALLKLSLVSYEQLRPHPGILFFTTGGATFDIGYSLIPIKIFKCFDTFLILTGIVLNLSLCLKITYS